MKLIRALLLLLAAAGCASAQSERTFVRNYDLASASRIYCSTTDYVAGLGRLSTSGSSTTVTATGSGSVLRQLVAGDEIFVSRPSFPGSPTMTVDRRVVQTAPTTNTGLTITAVADWTGGFAWRYRHVTCGTGAEDGWLTVAHAAWTNVKWTIASMSATSIDLAVECRDTGDSAGGATVVYPNPSNSASTDECLKGNYTAANKCGLIIEGHWSECRFGAKINTDTGTQDITATLNTGSTVGIP